MAFIWSILKGQTIQNRPMDREEQTLNRSWGPLRKGWRKWPPNIANVLTAAKFLLLLHGFCYMNLPEFKNHSDQDHKAQSTGAPCPLQL